MLGLFLVIAGLLAIGAILGGYYIWRQYRHRPTNDALKLTNRMYLQQKEDLKTVVRDCLNGLDLIGHYVASLQLSQPSKDLDKVVNAIHSLQQSLSRKTEESHLLTPLHDTNPFGEVNQA